MCEIENKLVWVVKNATLRSHILPFKIQIVRKRVGTPDQPTKKDVNTTHCRPNDKPEEQTSSPAGCYGVNKGENCVVKFYVFFQ